MDIITIIELTIHCHRYRIKIFSIQSDSDFSNKVINMLVFIVKPICLFFILFLKLDGGVQG